MDDELAEQIVTALGKLTHAVEGIAACTAGLQIQIIKLKGEEVPPHLHENWLKALAAYYGDE